MRGELDGAMHYLPEKNLVDRSKVDVSGVTRYLFPDPAAEGRRYFAKTGLFPINHTVVVRRSLLESHPWIALNLYSAFVAAKEEIARSGNAFLRWYFETGLLDDGVKRTLAANDPLAYGFKAARPVLETIAQYVHEQGLCAAPRRPRRALRHEHARRVTGNDEQGLRLHHRRRRLGRLRAGQPADARIGARACCCSKPAAATAIRSSTSRSAWARCTSTACSTGAITPSPSRTSNGRRIEAMRGKVLGGSSSINVMAYTRGHRGDYDRWAQKGALGWSYADVLPYFKRVETWEDGENAWRGGDGPIGIAIRARRAIRCSTPGSRPRKAAGLPLTDDYNGEQQEGFGRSQYTIRDGRRSSAATAYLQAGAEAAAISTVETGAHATRVLMQGTRATGVEYVKAAATCVRADAEPRGDPRRRRVQHAAAPDAVGHRPGRRICARSASSRSSICRSARTCRIISAVHDHVRAAERQRVPPRDAVRPHGGQHDPRLFLRHRPGDRGAGRAARLHQDAARARGARHRVHVPRRAGACRICGFR